MTVTGSREALKDCPFCKGTDLHVGSWDVQPDNWWSGHVCCHGCDTEGPKPETWLSSKEEAETEAVIAWNTRAADPAPVLTVEEIAREIRRAMLDNPTEASFNKRAAARERIADEYARTILSLLKSRSVLPGDGGAS